MIIRHKRIEAAGCILPVSHDLNIPKELGLRHRAAMGVSQEQMHWPLSFQKKQVHIRGL